MSGKHLHTINRDISWLSFNDRVLQEAADPNVPILERLKFLGIFSNNQDEFFRVRVATLRRMTGIGKKAKSIIGDDPGKILVQIQKTVISQQKKFEKIYQQIIKELEKQKIFIINEHQLTPDQGKFIRSYFQNKIRPALVPIMLDKTREFPYLKDKVMYLLIKLNKKDAEKKPRHALLEIPTDIISRFLVLPDSNGKYIILIEDVIRFCFDEIFSLFDYESIEAYTIKLTRDAELDIDHGVNDSLVEKITKSLKKRVKGQPVRLVYDSAIAGDLFELLIKKLNLSTEDNLIPGGRYHNFKDFIKFPILEGENLWYEPLPPVPHKALINQRSIFEVIKQRDILLAYPYQTFNHVIDLLREAAIDPKVTSIKITLYRVANNSHIINALINAARNGKEVTVIVELRARFDEEANIYWANALQEEGIKVVYGVAGLKVHSKIFLISRREDNKILNFAHIGTGNFHEGTAQIYSDFSLLTADKRITSEVEKTFHFFNDNFKITNYRHLLVSPFFLRRKLLQLIDAEIKNARQKKPAYIIIKLNSISDDEFIKKLYDAARAGVKIKLIIRGICSIMAGVKAAHDNIEIYSLVDRFLEHSRIFLFANAGDEKIFISSADLMVRNLDYRVEVACPIYNKNLKKIFRKFLDLQLKGNVKVRLLNDQQTNPYKPSEGEPPFRAQYEIYNYFTQKLTQES